MKIHNLNDIFYFFRYNPNLTFSSEFWFEKRVTNDYSPSEQKRLMLQRSCRLLVHETMHLLGFSHRSCCLLLLGKPGPRGTGWSVMGLRTPWMGGSLQNSGSRKVPELLVTLLESVCCDCCGSTSILGSAVQGLTKQGSVSR